MRGSAWLAAVLAICCGIAPAGAANFALVDAPNAAGLDPSRLAPRTIVFFDQPGPGLNDSDSGLMRFEDWERARPVQKELLALYPSYTEPVLETRLAGLTRKVREKLNIYVAQARLLLDRPPAAVDLGKLVDFALVKRLDPAIAQQKISAADTKVATAPRAVGNLLPQRKWCEGRPGALCLRSRYQFEGKLPLGIKLANKLREDDRQIADYLEFESELAQLSAEEIAAANYPRLTGLDTPVTAAIEQNIFYVNQVMQFGKLLAVLQADPADPSRTVASIYIALAVEASLLGKKKEFAEVPVLRNMVPVQVLAGRSTFNTGTSISAGLPVYARNRIKAIVEEIAGR